MDRENDLSPSLGGQTHLTGEEPSIGGERASQAARSGLASDDWHVRVRAAQELARRGDESAIRDLVASLNDWNGAVRSAVAEALLRISPSAAPSLLECLPQADTVTGRIIVRVLSDLGAPASPYLVEALQFSLPRARRDILVALGNIGHEPAIPMLIELLGDEAPEMRFAATKELSQFKELAAPALMNALDSPNRYIRYGACDLLGRLRYKNATPKLVELVRDDEPSVRKQALQALGEIGTKDSIELLVELIDDKSEDVRDYVVLALGRAHHPRSMEALITIAENDTSLDVRRHAIQQLGSFKAIRAIPALGKLLETELDFHIRDSILRALASIHHADAVPWVYSVLDDPTSLKNVAYEAMHMLSDTEHPLIGIHFRNELKSERTQSRLLAIEVLGNLKDTASVPDLIELLSDRSQRLYRGSGRGSEPTRVCDLAAQALEQIRTPEARKALISWRQQQSAG